MKTLTIAAPRSVFCVIDAEHRDLRAGYDAAAGRFTIQGTTLELGLQPDWIGAAFPADREWRIEWSKFYFGLDLAWAYRRTRDSRFVRAWEQLVESWIDQVPIEFDTTDVIARRVQNWIYAWHGFNRVPGTEIGERTAARMLASLEAQVRHLRANLSAERNHRTLELYALFIAALALPALDPDGSLQAFALSALTQNLLDDVLGDGVHREASSHYHMLVLRSFLGVMENARRCGIALPSEFPPRVSRACQFAIHLHRPDGQIPALSDSDSGSYRRLLRMAARLFGRRDWLYVATAGRRGTPPLAAAASFDRGGYFVQRSGWGDAATFARQRYLLFDCGPLGDGGHGHYDMLNVEIAAGGQPLIVDPGRYTYHADEGDGAWRRWFKGTAAHNTVTVDGLDQVPYRPGRPKGPLPRACFGGRATHLGLDVMWGRVESPCYDAVHERRILFVAGEYWIIEDRLTAPTPHRYDLRFHLSVEASADAHVYGGSLPAASAGGVALVFGGAPEVALERGWVSPSYGVKHPAAVVVATERGCGNARFITLVAPRAHHAPLPRVRVETAPAAPVTVVAIDGMSPGSRDVITWSAAATSGDAELQRTRARA